VCVIGSGAAGITLAEQLDGSPLRVLVLEAGGPVQDTATEDDCFAVEHLGTPYGNAIPTRGRWFGGSTNLWFGRIAKLDRIDFEERAWVPFSGWPVGYDELEPWVERAARILDVPHFDKISIENWSTNPTIETFLQHGGASLGVFLWANALYMGPHYRKALAASRNVRVLLNSTVTKLEPNAEGNRIERLQVCGAPGQRFEVRAKVVVLAAGGLENPRLLLASGSRPEGIANAEDLVGRYYIDHPRGESLGSVDLRGLDRDTLARLLLLGEKRRSQYGKVQLRVTFPTELQRREGLLNNSLHAHLLGAAHLSDGYRAVHRLAARAKQQKLGGGGLRDELLRVTRDSPKLVRLAAQSVLGPPQPAQLLVVDQMEQEPDPNSRVTLDRDKRDKFGMPKLRLDWRIGESTYRSQERMHRLFKEILESVGIHTFQSQVLDQRGERPRLVEMKHPSGTTRMSASPKRGVVDADCRVHGIGNLFVAGSSVFPTSGHANPTLLIVALAARLAERLKREVQGLSLSGS
jgi:choline dehydrogenase-like flavoprotein